MARTLALVLSLLLAAGVAAGDQSPLATLLLADQRTLDDTRELTASIGPRLTGSAAYERAAEWSAQRLRAAGLDRVMLEPFTLGRGWERELARARIIAPIDQMLHVAALGWTPSTAEGGVEGDVVALTDLAPETIARRTSLRGRIVLLPDGERGGTPDRINAARRELDARLRDAGVRALLSADGAPDNVLSARDRVYGGTISALPAAQIGREDAQTIRRLLNRGPIRIAIELRNRITDAPVTVHNVVGEFRGRERPDEWVILGAHLDSWDFSAAAQDNATGVAMVLAAARAIAARELRPRRSIRFALWGGEEQGQLGSSAYVRAHGSELDRAIATLNSDAGTGRIIGWTTPGRADVMSAVRQLMHEVLDDLGSGSLDRSMQYAFQSDGAPFILAGVPTLDLNADDSKYEDIHHRPTDTIERVDARNLAIGAATVAVTAFAIADAPKRIAPHLEPEAVRRLLKRAE